MGDGPTSSHGQPLRRDILNAVRHAIVCTDIDGNVQFWNPAAEELFGYPPEEAEGRGIMELVVPKRVHDEVRKLMSRIRNGEDWSGEMRFRRRDGSTFPAAVTGTPLYDDDGNLSGAVGVATDLTETERQEFELSERVKELRLLHRASKVMNRHEIPVEERLRTLVDEIPDGWLYPDVTEARITLGELSLTTSGYEPSPWTQTAPIPVGDQEGRLEVVLTEEREERDEGPFLREERNLLDNLASTISDGISHSRLTNLFERTFECLEEAVVLIDGKRRIREVNPAAVEMFGYAREELRGEGTEILHVDRQAYEIFGEKSEQELKNDGVFHTTAQMRRKDGSLFESEHTVTLLNPEEGPAGGAVSVVRDVSREKELEEMLRRSQRMEAVGRLAGGIAHDFNNLMTVIRVQSDLLLIDHGPDSTVGQEVAVIQEATERAASLTSDLLSFSREQVLQPKVVCVNEIVRAMGRMLDRVLGEGIDLVYDLSEELPSVEVDPGQTEQVVMNVVVNARDAMPNGGTVRFESKVETVSPGAADGEELPPGEYVALSISDTGVGMDDETLDRVFDPFFTTKETGKGTGLGLAMAYGFVTQSGGSIRAESTPGEGTTITLLLPIAGDDDAERDEAPRREPTTPDASALTMVLVVEDSDDVRRVATRVLERAGYAVSAFGNAAEALEAVRGGLHVDVVLTDLVLPGMSGPEMVAELREEWPRLGIVAMSGYSHGRSDRRRLPDDVEFIQKPFSPAVLTDAIERGLGE